MSDLDMAVPLTFTDAAANKVKSLISEEENNELKLRVYITGGGCSGFQYGFTFDDKVNEGDLTIEKAGVQLVIDPMSLQYLIGGTVDYTEGLEGVTTGELDRICHDYMVNVQKVIPACLNYHGFPKATCISINEVVCHGIPSDDKKLKQGDIVNIDVTVIKDGKHWDESWFK